MTVIAPVAAAPAPYTPAPLHASDDRPLAIEIRGLAKRFPRRRSVRELVRGQRLQLVDALTDVSLAIPAGSCFGILGPNGAGKSTLFRILGTLVLPDEGSASVSGLDVVEDALAVRTVVASAGSDERSLFWRLSAAENLRLYASLQGLRGSERSARIEEALAVVGLAEMDRRMVGTFSSGLRQRLLLARALISSPRILLLDEPTRSLDPVAARDFRHFLRREIVERRGCTVLLATHGADEAFDLCDEVAVLDRGRVVAQGRAAELAAGLRADRVVVWTSDAGHPALSSPAVLGDGVARVAMQHPEVRADACDMDARWRPVVLHVPGGADGSAALLGRLTSAGVPVARLEAVRPSLAELLSELTGVARGRDDG